MLLNDMKHLLIVIASLFFYGCGGFATIGVEEKVSNYTHEDAPSKEDVLSRNKWRNAPIETSDNDHDILTYTDKQWCGMMFFIIPLMLPVCDSTDTYSFQENILVKESIKSSKVNGVLCSVYPTCDETGNNCTPCFTN